LVEGGLSVLGDAWQIETQVIATEVRGDVDFRVDAGRTAGARIHVA
jgi:hypothetical protein